MKITAKQLAQTLYDLTDGKSESEAEKSVGRFAEFIIKDRKLKLADKIIEQFGKVYNQKKGIVEAKVVTRKKMDEAAERKVKDYIEKKYHAKKVVLKNIVDEDIKGGMIIRVGDEVTDGSVAGRLISLRKKLTS